MISYLIAFSLSHRSARRQPTMIKEVRFAPDSALEGNGFKLPVPLEIDDVDRGLDAGCIAH